MIPYKVKVFLNRIPLSYDIKSDFESARLYNAKHNVDLLITYHDVDIRGYSSTFNASKNRWLLAGAENQLSLDNTTDAHIFIFDEAEFETKPDSLKINTPTGDCHIPQTPGAKPFITIGAYPSDHANGITKVAIAHEIMHSYVQNSLLQGTFVHDCMDDYVGNNFSDTPDTNFSRQWILLIPFIGAKQGLQATLTRLYDYGRETVGKLTVESLGFECNTIELGWHDNQNNISSIPVGQYLVKWTFSPLHLKYSYEIQKVPKRGGIRIDIANWYSQLLGCVALGRGYGNLNSDELPDILNSKKTVDEFTTLMNKRDFYLTVQ